MNRRKLLDDLQFNYCDIVDDQIRTKVRLEIVTFVNERNSTIGSDSMLVSFEFNDQADLVDRFE